MATDCIFCKIITKDIPATIIAENDECLVIKDIAPQAPIHYLVIPKKHIENLHAITHADQQLMGAILLTAHEVAQRLPVPRAFNFIINNGKEVGQTVFHLHGHILSGH